MMHLSINSWVFVLLACGCIFPSLHGFVAPERIIVSRHPWAASPSSSSEGNLYGKQQEQTLYNLLGASPTEPHEALKARYIGLVRTLHPDARVGQEDNESLLDTSYADLSDINAAWQILSDPKERLRYDRTLKAKQVSEDLERFVEVGFRAAIPFLRKTADTTVAAAKTSSKVINKGAAKAKRAMEVFDVNESIRQLEQRAARDHAKAQRLKEMSNNLPNTKLPILLDSNAKLGSTESMRIMKSFRSVELNLVETDIAMLEEMERLQRESARTLDAKEKATRLAQRQLEQAARAEEACQQRLQEAQRALAQAQANHQMEKQACTVAVQETALATTETDKRELSLVKASTKVRVGLVKMQDKYLNMEAQRLQVESQRLEESAKTLKAQAKQLKEEANKLEQEQ